MLQKKVLVSVEFRNRKVLVACLPAGRPACRQVGLPTGRQACCSLLVDGCGGKVVKGLIVLEF